MEQEKMIELVKQAQAGDSAAMERLLTCAHTPVSYQCRKFMKSPEDAEDMTQEVMMTVFEKLNTLKEPAAFYGWVKRIAATRCMNAVGRTHKELQFAEDEDGNSFIDNIEELDAQKIPDAAIDNAETSRMVVELIDGLPEAQRICTYLYYYDELSVKEIAKLTEVPENTVKSRLNYARKAIKEGVLDHEKKGVKLYGLSPLPFLLYFLRKAAQAEANETAAASCAASVMAANTAAATTVEAATASGSVAGHAVGFLSGKLIAGIVAGVVALAGVTVAAVQLINAYADSVPAFICQHEWTEADCVAPRICDKCDSTEGEALGHTWRDADCEHAKTCSVCGAAEGEALGHTWADATCETAKTCEICGVADGEALGHDMAEANYQQPATCKVCGYIEGDVLPPDAAGCEVDIINPEMGKEYQYTTSCWDNDTYKTVATVTLTDYSVFESAEGCAALDGYEWHSATFHIFFNDENAWNYGMKIQYYGLNYYEAGDLVDIPLDGTFFDTVNFNGIEYDKCLHIVSTKSGDWDRENRSIYYDITYTWRMPIGYDGCMFCLFDPEYLVDVGEDPYANMDPNALIFRF